jgi:hypothetical protein
MGLTRSLRAISRKTGPRAATGAVSSKSGNNRQIGRDPFTDEERWFVAKPATVKINVSR